MALPCFYHKKVQAVAVCDECGKTICDACTQAFREYNSCPKCVEKVRLMATPKEAAPIDYKSAGIKYRVSTPAVERYAADDKSNVAVMELEPPKTETITEITEEEEPLEMEYDPARSLMGLAFGLIVGAVGCLLIMKLLEHTWPVLSLFYIGVGVLVARSMKAVARQGNVELALGAVVVMVTGLLFAHIAFTQDMMRAGIVNIGGHAFTTFAGAFSALMSHMGGVHWISALLGIAACWRSAKQP
jgi:hypothetical protein